MLTSPKSGAVVNLLNPSCPWLVLAPKVFQLCIHHLMFGFVQTRVSSWCLSLFLVSSKAPTPPPPQSVASQGTCLDSLFFHYFQFKLTFESIKEFRSVSLTIAPPPHKNDFFGQHIIINMILDQHIVINFHEKNFNILY